jgi:NAD(P)H-dependent FMN reductase
MEGVQFLLISGSTRDASTNTAALVTLAALAPSGSAAVLYGGLADLPAFNPDDDRDPLPPSVATLRAAIAAADAIVFCTPEYAGTLPGAFKNLLDWTVGGVEISDRPVAWINVAGDGRGVGATATLQTVLAYVGTRPIVDACIDVPTRRDMVESDGTITDPSVRQRLATVWSVIGDALAG